MIEYSIFNLKKHMESTNLADMVFGIVALAIVLSGMFLLFQGVGAMNKKE